MWFPVKKGVFARTVGYVKAVDGVSFTIHRGETLGVVGESGSGKSTIARVIAGLQKPTSGEVVLHGRVGMVFQDPLGSLNPRFTVRELLKNARPQDVGLDDSLLDKYPHELSGGQRQRVCIARAIATEPDLLICDEAVSALDLSIRAEILDLLADLRRRLGLSMIFITHDLGVAQRIADRLIVVNAGRIVEEGPCEKVLKTPVDDYTKRLIAAVPHL